MFNLLIPLVILLTSVSTYIEANNTDQENKIEFVILITSYNNEKYAQENLESVCHQKSTNPYQVICINDCSMDKTKRIMNQYVRKYNLESFVKVIHNETRVGAMHNIYHAIHDLIPDHKIVVSVDGDDRLAHDEVLLHLEKMYSNPNVWMTYGNALMFPRKGLLSKKIPLPILRQGRLRQYPFVAQHLRTFKAGLFKKIAKTDLMYKGKFFQMTWDMAMMYPMLEMASPYDAYSPNHSRFIPDVLYHYRMNNPINDFRVNEDLQTRLGEIICQMPPYKPIKKL